MKSEGPTQVSLSNVRSIAFPKVRGSYDDPRLVVLSFLSCSTSIHAVGPGVFPKSKVLKVKFMEDGRQITFCVVTVIKCLRSKDVHINLFENVKQTVIVIKNIIHLDWANNSNYLAKFIPFNILGVSPTFISFTFLSWCKSMKISSLVDHLGPIQWDPLSSNNGMNLVV